MIMSVPAAWHVSTTTAKIPALEHVVRTLTVRSGTIDQSAAVRRASEVTLSLHVIDR